VPKPFDIPTALWCIIRNWGPGAHAPPGQTSEGDILSEQSRKFSIGVVGDVSALLPFWEIMRDRVNGRALSTIGLVAAALTGTEVENRPGRVADMGLPLYGDFREMLSAHPEINLIIEASSQPSLLAELRTELPPGVILLERAAASFFVQLMAEDQMGLVCRIDRQNTLNMLTSIIDQMTDDILFLDPEGMVVNCNKNACALLGNKRETVGRSYQEVLKGMSRIANGDPASAWDPFQRTLKTSQPAEALASEVDEQGHVRYFRVYAYPIMDMARLSHVVLIRRDITRRTHIEQRLQQSEKLASIGELSTYIAHEIRNPLMAISGFANSLLRSGEMDEASREKLGIILSESKRLDAILKSVTNFARPLETHAEEVDVNRVARTTMEVMGLGSEKQGIEIRLDLQEGLARAKADPELITQCLINMVKNALEAMAETGGLLTVRTALKLDRVVLEVEDTGPGIPRELRTMVFSPFYSSKGKGAGLGLAMVRKVMDQIGGDVKLVSRQGRGTRVTLELPPSLAVAKTTLTG